MNTIPNTHTISESAHGGLIFCCMPEQQFFFSPLDQMLICNVHTSQNVTAETSAGRQSIIQIIIFFNNMTFFKWPSSTLIKPNYGWSPHHIWVFQPMSAVWNAVSSHYIKFVYCLFIPYTIHQSGMLVCRPCIYCFLNCVPAVKLDFSSS